MNLALEKLEGWGDRGENFIILTSTAVI